MIVWEKLSLAILQVRDVPTLGYGHVYFVKSNGGVMSMTYKVTIGVIPNCTCFDFVTMLTSLKKKGKFIPFKYLYFIHRTRMFCNHKTNDFINQPTFSINEFKKLLE